MCQYSSVHGLPTDWHLVHLGSLARGGAGLIMSEATAVTPEGRISPTDAGIWNDERAAAYERITAFVRSMGAVAGIQLAHAGRTGSTRPPWEASGYVEPAAGGVADRRADPARFGDWPIPKELTPSDISGLVAAFADAAQRAVGTGFEVADPRRLRLLDPPVPVAAVEHPAGRLRR